ncbi:hypothetical protein M0657_004575 [Pyricularia oryzae]|nr:hypothetical protein M9X92_006359 [Pyricularia oryzae]KAI7924531.1 hypothetical protein M0657_004575 [Pyricularia oryzae]
MGHNVGRPIEILAEVLEVYSRSRPFLDVSKDLVVINTYAWQQHASSVKVTGTRAAIPGTVGINKLVVSKVYNGMELRGQGNAMSR